MDVEAILSDFICRELLFNDRTRMPGADQPLLGLEGGVVDSVGLQHLIAFVESEFGVLVDDLDIVPENFETLGALVAYIKRKQSIGQKQP